MTLPVIKHSYEKFCVIKLCQTFLFFNIFEIKKSIDKSDVVKKAVFKSSFSTSLAGVFFSMIGR